MDYVHSAIAVAATIAGLVTSATLQDLRAQTVEPIMIAFAEEATGALKHRGLIFAQTARVPPMPERAGRPAR